MNYDFRQSPADTISLSMALETEKTVTCGPSSHEKHDIREKIKEAINLGYGVIRLVSRNKTPAKETFWGPNEGWKDNIIKDPSRVDEVFQPDSNYGIVCHDLLVLDIDGPDGEDVFKEMEKELGPIPKNAPMVTTGREKGVHVYFRRPQEDVINRVNMVWKEKETNIDVRVGNAYVVGAGSIHPNGETYETIIPLCKIEELPELPRAMIDILPKRERKEASPMGITPAMMKNDDVVERCRRYVQQMPDSISGSNGHDALLNVANAIFWGFGLSKNDGWPILCEYNKRANPCWSDNELRHKVQEAQNKPVDKEFGYLRDTPTNQWATSSTQSNHPQSTQWATSLTNKQRRSRYRFLRKDTDENKWLWENKFVAKHVNLILGKPGSGKTFFTCYLAGHITQGIPWPDGTPCQKGSVLFFKGEDNVSEMKGRLESNGADMNLVRLFEGIETPDENNGTFLDEVTIEPRNRGVIIDTIREVGRETGIPVQAVFVDPLGNFWGKLDENSHTESREGIRNLQNISEETGATFFVIHHTGKGDRSDARDTGLGSSGIQGHSRTVWTLSCSPYGDDPFYVTYTKSNIIKKENQNGLVFKINNDQSVDFVEETDLDTNGVLKLIREQAYQSQSRPKKEPKVPVSDIAGNFLREFLSNGPKLKEEVIIEGRKKGITTNAIKDAKSMCGVVHKKDKTGKYFWGLTNTDFNALKEANEADEADEANELAETNE